MKQRYLRQGDDLSDSSEVVVRGGDLDPELLRAAGLRLEPTGRNPRHFDVTFEDLDRGVAGLAACEYRTVVNPYNEA